jgi:hypothetical protein
MTGHVHAFDAREGGRFRMTLTYQDPEHSPRCKTTEDSDTFQARFVELVSCEKSRLLLADLLRRIGMGAVRWCTLGLMN